MSTSSPLKGPPGRQAYRPPSPAAMALVNVSSINAPVNVSCSDWQALVHPGTYLGSVVEELTTTAGSFEIETFYYYAGGCAQGHSYIASRYEPMAAYSATLSWLVSSADQLHQWLRREQLASGLRSTFRRQHAAAQAQGRDNVPALNRLLSATIKASEQADTDPVAPIFGWPRYHKFCRQ